jgi:apyrase
VFSISIALFAFVLITPRSVLHALVQPSSAFAVVLDAGSSGTRVHVFRFTPQAGHTPRLLQHPFIMKQTPGLSAFVDEPEKAAEQISTLLRFARSKVPAPQRGDTPVVLLATAGLRLLAAQRGEAAAESVLEACRPVLQDSAFLFRDEWAHILPGSDEGAFAWVAANYAAGTLDASHKDNNSRRGGDVDVAAASRTLGVLELGGASVQVTYAVDDTGDGEATKRVALSLPAGSGPQHGGASSSRTVSYTLYTRSFLGLGLDAAIAAASAFPGSVQHTRDSADGGASAVDCRTFAACRAVAAHLLGLGKVTCQEGTESASSVGRRGACIMSPSSLGSQASVKPHSGIFVPAVRGEFVALENFKHVVDALNVGSAATLAQLSAAGDAACRGRHNGKSHAMSQAAGSHMPPLCFASAYVFTLLHDALGVPLHDGGAFGELDSTSVVRFVDTVHGIGVDWPLGALVAQYGALAHGPARGELRMRTAIGLLTLCACILPAVLWARQTDFRTLAPAKAGAMPRSVSDVSL